MSDNTTPPTQDMSQFKTEFIHRDYELENFAETKKHLMETTVSKTMIEKGMVVNFRRDDARQPDGVACKREVLEHPGGVVIMPVLPDGKILLVEQWRYALGRTLIELPAGKLDPGEHKTPYEAARRELIEETGYAPGVLEELTFIYTSPGFCDERLYLFKATELVPVDNPEQYKMDDEFIDIHKLTPDEAFEWVRQGKIVDAKTISLLLFLKD